MDTGNLNTTALAFIGDAVYEVYVRKHVLATGRTHTDLLHKMAVRYVRADGQALAIKTIMKRSAGAQDGSDETGVRGAANETAGDVNTLFVLTPGEAALVRRARNHKSASKPKNADPVTYKWATAFEALVGQLHLSGQEERESALIASAIEIIERSEQ